MGNPEVRLSTSMVLESERGQSIAREFLALSRSRGRAHHLFQDAILRLLSSNNLEYKELTKIAAA